MRIGSRVSLGISIVVLLSALLGVLGWFALERYSKSVASEGAISTVVDNLLRAQIGVTDFIQSEDPKHANGALDRISEAEKVLQSNISLTEIKSALVGPFAGMRSAILSLIEIEEQLVAQVDQMGQVVSDIEGLIL